MSGSKPVHRKSVWTGRAVAVLAACMAGPPVFASVGLYVGKNLTADGSVLLGGYGDEPSSHWLAIIPRLKHDAGATIEVGTTSESRYPGVRSRIPQVPETYKYITVQYSAYAGFPPPLENGGMNEHGVAARDIACGSRKELRAMIPNPQPGGLSYSDLSRIAMQRARTAREAAQIVGQLVEKYGEATYGGNSHIFADRNEGWVLIEFAGGKGLWAAARLGPDEVRVVRGGCGYREVGEIEIPANFQETADYMGSRNLIPFAVEQGWYDPKSGKPLSLNQTFLSRAERPAAEKQMEEFLRKRAPRVTFQDMMAAVRSPEITRESAGYGQVAHLRSYPHPELAVLWVAVAPSVASPFVPYRIGVDDVPPEYKMHRYLTEGEASKFTSPDFQARESTRYAYGVFKRLFHLTCEHYKKFLAEVTEALTAFESKLIAAQPIVERTAGRLYDQGETELARRYLTYYSNTEAMEALRLTEALSHSIEARTRVLFGIKEPAGGAENSIIHCRDQ